MNKGKILLIGCGKAGNKLVNEMLKRDNRYTGLFVNTAYEDMADLEMFTNDNAFLFKNTNGSGRNRELAKDYIRQEIQPLVDRVAEYPMQDVITIFTSADGGTGSGITPMLIKLLRMTFDKDLEEDEVSDIKINLVAIAPDYKLNDKIAFENTISFWNEIMEIKDDCLDDIKFIDNSKGRNYAEINKRAVEALDNAYSMNGNSDEGDIDDMDARTFNTDKGFGLVLTLSEDYRTAQKSVEEAIKNSVFAIPDSYDCNYLGISVREDSFPLQDIRDCFENVYGTTYKTCNEKHNTVVLGGCDVPSEIIELIKAGLEEIKEKVGERESSSKYIVEIEKSKPIKRSKSRRRSKVSFSEEELDNIQKVVSDLFK